ncbi:unnamed protein product [Owenia fusiformis]|uniref:DRBM domain-containing protein n=1 Tax=Owenia fusiformis TaxID=6347 RepID=A0A8S4PYH3_OWEFU|nr:unnamed protein product [Owenia fusiformis]
MYRGHPRGSRGPFKRGPNGRGGGPPAKRGGFYSGRGAGGSRPQMGGTLAEAGRIIQGIAKGIMESATSTSATEDPGAYAEDILDGQEKGFTDFEGPSEHEKMLEKELAKARQQRIMGTSNVDKINTALMRQSMDEGGDIGFEEEYDDYDMGLDDFEDEFYDVGFAPRGRGMIPPRGRGVRGMMAPGWGMAGRGRARGMLGPVDPLMARHAVMRRRMMAMRARGMDPRGHGMIPRGRGVPPLPLAGGRGRGGAAVPPQEAPYHIKFSRVKQSLPKKFDEKRDDHHEELADLCNSNRLSYTLVYKYSTSATSSVSASIYIGAVFIESARGSSKKEARKDAVDAAIKQIRQKPPDFFQNRGIHLQEKFHFNNTDFDHFTRGKRHTKISNMAGLIGQTQVSFKDFAVLETDKETSPTIKLLESGTFSHCLVQLILEDASEPNSESETYNHCLVQLVLEDASEPNSESETYKCEAFIGTLGLHTMRCVGKSGSDIIHTASEAQNEAAQNALTYLRLTAPTVKMADTNPTTLFPRNTDYPLPVSVKSLGCDAAQPWSMNEGALENLDMLLKGLKENQPLNEIFIYDKTAPNGDFKEIKEYIKKDFKATEKDIEGVKYLAISLRQTAMEIVGHLEKKDYNSARYTLQTPSLENIDGLIVSRTFKNKTTNYNRLRKLFEDSNYDDVKHHLAEFYFELQKEMLNEPSYQAGMILQESSTFSLAKTEHAFESVTLKGGLEVTMCSIRVFDILVGRGLGSTQAEAKHLADKVVYRKLQKLCWTVKIHDIAKRMELEETSELYPDIIKPEELFLPMPDVPTNDRDFTVVEMAKIEEKMATMEASDDDLVFHQGFNQREKQRLREICAPFPHLSHKSKAVKDHLIFKTKYPVEDIFKAVKALGGKTKKYELIEPEYMQFVKANKFTLDETESNQSEITKTRKSKRHFKELIIVEIDGEVPLKDPMTSLDRCADFSNMLLEYKHMSAVINNDMVHLCYVSLEGYKVADGRGLTKDQAKAHAASQVFEALPTNPRILKTIIGCPFPEQSEGDESNSVYTIKPSDLFDNDDERFLKKFEDKTKLKVLLGRCQLEAYCHPDFVDDERDFIQKVAEESGFGTSIHFTTDTKKKYLLLERKLQGHDLVRRLKTGGLKTTLYKMSSP